VSETVREVDREDLPENLRTGLQALERTHGHLDVEPIIEVGNFVVVRLGTFDVTGPEFDEDTSGAPLSHVHDEYRVFVRLPRAFPDGGRIKGFGTSPPLAREDRGVQNNASWEPEVQDQHEAHHDGTVEWYSWNWDGFPTSDPEHVKFAHDTARRMLKHA
jgi:hypothetical protein